MTEVSGTARRRRLTARRRDAAPRGWSTSATRTSPPASRSPRGRLLVSPEVLELLRGDGVPKGDALGVARRRRDPRRQDALPDLIPLCHPMPLSGVEVDLDLADDAIEITAR